MQVGSVHEAGWLLDPAVQDTAASTCDVAIWLFSGSNTSRQSVAPVSQRHHRERRHLESLSAGKVIAVLTRLSSRTCGMREVRKLRVLQLACESVTHELRKYRPCAEMRCCIFLDWLTLTGTDWGCSQLSCSIPLTLIKGGMN